MELLTFNIDISSFYPPILRKMHTQFNTMINDNSLAVQMYKQNKESLHVIELLCYNWRFANFWMEIWSRNWRFFIDVCDAVFIVY